ncbi:unnamed protein product, partial [Ceratitis capitata]
NKLKSLIEFSTQPLATLLTHIRDLNCSTLVKWILPIVSCTNILISVIEFDIEFECCLRESNKACI